MKRKREIAGPYQIFMLALCTYAIAEAVLRAFVPLRPETVQVLKYADTAVCIFFFLDFIVSLVRAENRWRYLVTWGWVDLLSSLPAVPLVRWGRLLRIIRLVRVMRTVKATHVLVSVILARRAESTFLAVSLLSILILTIGSVAILKMENVPGSNIKTPSDACWWALSTMTTVGFGDRYPVTGPGRLIGAALMITGVGLVGTFAGFVASWFHGQAQTRQGVEIDELRKDIHRLHESVERVAPSMRGPMAALRVALRSSPRIRRPTQQSPRAGQQLLHRMLRKQRRGLVQREPLSFANLGFVPVVLVRDHFHEVDGDAERRTVFFVAIGSDGLAAQPAQQPRFFPTLLERGLLDGLSRIDGAFREAPGLGAPAPDEADLHGAVAVAEGNRRGLFGFGAAGHRQTSLRNGEFACLGLRPTRPFVLL
jgi:voltage-gated potassium channel